MPKAGIGVIVAGVVGFASLYMAVRGYLRSDGFREFLSGKASELAKVDGEFSEFRWDGLAVDSSVFQGTGEGLVKDLRLDGLHTEVKIGGLKRGVWEIGASRVKRLVVMVDARDLKGDAFGVAEPAEVPGAVKKKQAKKPGWLPSTVELESMDVDDVLVNALLDVGPITADGMRIRVEPSSGEQSYEIEVAGGTVELPFELVPPIRMERARLRYQNRQVFLNSLTAKSWKGGLLDASGEWDTRANRYALEGNVSGVKCEEVFNETWSKRFIGDMATSFTVDNLGGKVAARGHLDITKGSLTALPVLETLAAYADTRRFREFQLSVAETDWRWKDGEFFLSNLVLGSESLIRLEGNMRIRGRQLDGLFQLGLAPGSLAKIPGAETDVFSPGKNGLQWTSLRITGTLDDPEEDLSARLIEAAGMRMFDVIPETGEMVFKFTRSVLGDDPNKAVESGVKIIKKGSRAINDVSGILDGFFGRPSTPEPVEEQEAQ